MAPLRTTKRASKNDQFLTSYFDKFQNIYTFSSDKFIRGLQLLALICGLVTISIGSIAFAGLTYHVRILQSMFPGLPVINFDSAICFMCMGIALTLTQFAPINIYLRFLLRFIRDMALLITLIFSLGTLGDYAFHVGIGIDRYIFFSIPGMVHGALMGPLSALLFLFVSSALLLSKRRLLEHRLSQYLMLIAAIILSPTIIAYVYNMDFIYRLGIQLPLPSAIAFVLLIVGIFISFPQQGLMALIVSESAGGFMARKLLFTTILTPLLLGGIILAGYRLKLYDTNYELLLLVISTSVVYTVSIWRNAKDLHVVDVERQQSIQRVIFLSAVSRFLSTSLDYRSILNNVAQLAVGYIADWCVIDIVQPAGDIETVAIANRQHRKILWGQRMRKFMPVDMKSTTGIPQVLRTGKAEFYPVVTEEMMREEAKNTIQLQIMRQLHLQSVMIVPLFSHRKTIGTITFMSSNPELHYGQQDLTIAEEMAARASLAIENARLYKQAQDATKLRDEFISIASHELKTPVTSLKVYTQVIEQQLEKQRAVTELQYIQKMDGQLDKLTKLIEDLLNISRIKVGKLHFEEKVFSIGELVKELVEAIQPTLERHSIALNLIQDAMIVGDRDRIGQIVINLITNAIKYSPKANKVIITVTVIKQQKCVISVQDFGVGIERKNVGKIFERFYQVQDKKGRTFPGLGIGLYLSQEIARRHNGEIVVQSTKGKGSIFSLVLPIRKDEGTNRKRIG